MSPMKNKTGRWWVGLLCLALWPGVVSAQTALWEKHTAAGVKAYQQRRYAEAERSFQAALEAAQRFGPQDRRLVTSLSNLAELYSLQGQYAQAEPLFKRALAIRERALGPEHPDVATALSSLAELYRLEGEYFEADPLLRQALAIREQALGPEHPDVATTLSSLAEVYRLVGEYAEAEPLLKRALVIQERALGSEHPDVATTLNNLALLYYAQGRYAQNVAVTLNNPAELDRARGQYAQAELLFKRALTIREQALGPEHPDVARSLEHYSALLRKMNRAAEATEMEARAAAIWVKRARERPSK